MPRLKTDRYGHPCVSWDARHRNVLAPGTCGIHPVLHFRGAGEAFLPYLWNMHHLHDMLWGELSQRRQCQKWSNTRIRRRGGGGGGGIRQPTKRRVWHGDAGQGGSEVRALETTRP